MGASGSIASGKPKGVIAECVAIPARGRGSVPLVVFGFCETRAVYPISECFSRVLTAPDDVGFRHAPQSKACCNAAGNTTGSRGLPSAFFRISGQVRQEHSFS